MPAIINPELQRLHDQRDNVNKSILTWRKVATTRELTDLEKADLEIEQDILACADRKIGALTEALEAEETATVVRTADGSGLGMHTSGTSFTNYPQTSRPAITGRGGAAEFVAHMMGEERAPHSGFKSLAEFMAVVKSNRHDPRLVPLAAGQNEGSGAAGGFMVPEEHVVASLTPMYEHSIIIPLCDFHPMKSDKKTIAGWDSQVASGGTLFGGWTPEWIAESATMSVQTANVRQIKLQARKLALLAKSSNEIERDAEALPSMMTEGMGVSLAYTLDKAAMSGTGAGEPLGAMNGSSKITVTKQVGQAATTIVYQNLAKMFARMHPALLGGAIWMANSDTIPSLVGLTVDIGTGGAHIPVLTESNGEFRILTKPVVFTDHCQTLGTEGDICFVNWAAYALGMRKDISVEKSGHIYFESDETAYRSIARADGMPKMSSVFTPENGETKSWFVTVETRS